MEASGRPRIILTDAARAAIDALIDRVKPGSSQVATLWYFLDFVEGRIGSGQEIRHGPGYYPGIGSRSKCYPENPASNAPLLVEDGEDRVFAIFVEPDLANRLRLTLDCNEAGKFYVFESGLAGAM
ncbi:MULTISPECIES: hypothetical protein [unclassified Beijerinckia]|uniref:hypothetical protein n=1 Tax=unclassified Beijerinckia TaxID=2638183 RepID=UPI00089D0BA0|nr:MULTISPECIES: hypothetical protein [unclassified Beijerinckia]MDH7797260.1 hypothetical protein [Beijerinckia sp. GAS462]SEC78421.1 hypothetical protein SAMN05443249_3553 [Beijerinckia sp. 28-YEA-48]